MWKYVYLLLNVYYFYKTNTGPCHAINNWAGDPDMDLWCIENCAKGDCPPYGCECGSQPTTTTKPTTTTHRPTTTPTTTRPTTRPTTKPTTTRRTTTVSTNVKECSPIQRKGTHCAVSPPLLVLVILLHCLLKLPY